MAKWPFVYNEAGQKVFTIECAKTGETFTHVQTGRGRPPVYSPEGKAILEAERAAEAAARVPNRERVGQVRRENAVLRLEVADGVTPEPGDVVMRLTNGMKRENALRWLPPVRLISVEGETATVERLGETLTTKFANLVKLVPVQ